MSDWIKMAAFIHIGIIRIEACPSESQKKDEGGKVSVLITHMNMRNKMAIPKRIAEYFKTAAINDPVWFERLQIYK